MDRFDKHDLASLLDENSTGNRERKTSSNRRSEFLSTIQKSKTLMQQDNKYFSNTISSEDVVRIKLI